MDKDRALAIIDSALGKIPTLRTTNPGSPQHVEFVQTTGMELGRIFGPDSPVSRNFSSIRYHFSGSLMTNVWTHKADMASAQMGAYQNGLNQAEGVLLSARGQLEAHGVDRILAESRIRAGGAKVFISHGRESQALTKTERFLRALGLTPIVVMREASEGMSVDDLVDKRMAESDCVVILATADDDVGGYRQPRPNVLHEIGLAQERFPTRIIYLKEVGAEFPSNVRPKIWGDFSQDNMEGAFEKLSKELRAFGLL